SDDTIVGDPLVNGATLTVTANGATPTSGTFVLPSGMSLTTRKPFWSGDAVKGFRYSDTKGENGPVKKFQLKVARNVFQMKATVSGKLGPVDVTPPNPGTAGCARLGLVGGDDYDVSFTPGQVSNGGATYFRISRPTTEGSCTPAPVECSSNAVLLDQ